MSIGDFDPLWLDPQGRCLYAALHRAEPARPAIGVVLVPPLLHELPTSRRFLTEVAARLAAQGVPSLRFDFYGTGDSTGMGDEFDFDSMFIDLELAVAALVEQTGVARVVLMVWRGATLPVSAWLGQGGRADTIVLWEPIIDGLAWLRELERADARERAERPGAVSGGSASAADGQLMGFLVSPRLRRDLAKARLAGDWLQGATPLWVVTRTDAAELPMEATRILPLREGAPSFNGGAAMDTMFFLTPPIRKLVDELGQGLREQSWQ